MSTSGKPNTRHTKEKTITSNRPQRRLDVRAEPFLKAFYASPVPMAITVLADGSFVDVNESFLRLFEYTRQEVIGSTASELGLYDDPGDRVTILRLLKEHRAARDFERIGRTKTGKRVALLFSADTVTINGSDHVIGTAADITDRKRMEESLRSSEETARAILDATQETIILTDTSGILLAANAAAARRLGAEPREMIGRNLFDFMPADVGRRRNAASEEAVRTGRPVAFEDERRGRHFENVVYPVCNDAGQVTRLVIYAHDITERKRMEGELRKARDDLEQRLRERTTEALDAVKSLQIEVEVRKHSEQLLSEARGLASALSATSDLQVALYLCLDAALRVGRLDLGGIYLIDQVSGRIHLAAHRNIPPASLAYVQDYDNESPNARLVAACRPVYAHGRDLDVVPPGLEEIRGVAIIPICTEGKPVACLNLASHVIDDIPESTRTAIETIAAQVGAALDRIQGEEERKRLAAVIEHMEEGMLMVDRSFRIEYANPAFAHVTGYGQKELIGKDAKLLQSQMIDQSAYEASRERVQTRGSALVRATAKRKDGTSIPVEFFLSSVKADSGESIGYLIRCRDITEQVRLEEQLRQSQKMEAMGTLAGGVAHDFNNILAIILGNAELAEDDDDYRSMKQNVAQIVNASKRGRELVRQILTFSRRNEQNRLNLRMIPLLQETYRLLRASIPSTITMKLRMRTDGDIIHADATEMQQILMNLITNAAHSMREDGGRLTITLSDAAFTASGPFPEPDMRPGEYLKITVADTGAGMTPEVRKRIFDPFFTTKEVGHGTGMGLAVVYGIVKSYEGAVTVYSKKGKGSIFDVFIPKPPVAEVPETKQIGPAPRGTEHILIVDDEVPIAMMTRLTLERLGYRVTAATDPAEAWRLFRDQHYDLVITDQTMPGITGLALAQKMLKARKDIPIILCTGFSETASPEKAQSAGIAEYMMKPVDRHELAQTVRQVLDRKK